MTMSLRNGPHHKIWLLARESRITFRKFRFSQRGDEEGYTLVALLAVMTILALFAAAAAPSIRQQAQREREVEAIHRGEQVAAAIRLYYSYRQPRYGAGDASLPTSMDQLLEGVPSGTKKLQILRPSAARDPLSESAEWRLIRPRSSELAEFQRAVILFAGNVRPITRDRQLQQVEQLMSPMVLPTLGLASTGATSLGNPSSTGPFIGAASSSRMDSIIQYYGIGRHEEWVFTPLFR
jgi:type II secretory pathway pseudopilin PulG